METLQQIIQTRINQLEEDKIDIEQSEMHCILEDDTEMLEKNRQLRENIENIIGELTMMLDIHYNYEKKEKVECEKCEGTGYVFGCFGNNLCHICGGSGKVIMF